MLMPTIIAVALGIAPVNQDGSVATATDYSGQVGQYSQIIDRRGTTHVKGRDSRGRTYELVMNKNGYVDASFGELSIRFRVQHAI